MSYKIGSFNVRNLSYGAGASRDLDLIADIIKEFDIVALQEVLSEGKILTGPSVKEVSGQAQAYDYSLKKRLGKKWDMCWLDPHTDSKYYPYLGEDSRGEGYAFLWRTDKFQCPTNSYGEVRPRIIHQYRVNRNDRNAGELRLIRDPAYGRFKFVDMQTAELRLITTHIVFGKPAEGKLAKEIDYGAATMRQNEFRILAREIYTRVSEDHNDINCVNPYTIILGDYNLNLKDSGAGASFIKPVMAFDQNKQELTSETDSSAFYRIRTEQTDLSTISRDADQYANNYDHFSYDEEGTQKKIVCGKPHTLDVVKRAGDFETYKEKVSDHIPVMVEIDFK